ncbi:hypothetical protein RISK_004485 [Rhodopirellula islandica]|uniref:DUF7832 domain-containing protein n=2 Tax=Rhodopirellula islandica TaxID=595434 RepID=A0A0J1BAH2_RHOIS|nr:hypothetical protein RISK_004485 [Rhodopirellula islandica]
MKYFDVSWCESEDEMDEQARLFGTILAWAANNQHLSADCVEDNPDVLERVRSRSMDSGMFFADIAYALCDGKICDHDFTDAAQEFMSHYIDKNLKQFADDFYGVRGQELPADDSWDAYDRLAAVFDQRFSDWQAHS